METALKQSLLLTHGTIYGAIAPALSWHDCPGKPSGFAFMADQVAWRSGLYYSQLSLPELMGPVTDNAPIDVIQWTTVGHKGESGMEWWQQCVTLLMRHA